MSTLAPFISDLALILATAGIVTLLFKRLRQPLVLGYIVAGFLASKHMPYTPSVSDTDTVTVWADIGVVFLMFTLGLEFSFKRVVSMGMKPIVAACVVIFAMMSLGSAAGHLFGWGRMDSLFLGGMLAMSSTTIIYKAFDDLGLRAQKFTGEVLSVLILEDILGVLLMVVLSAMAVSRTFEGADLAASLTKLAFCLVLWFLVGTYIVPTLLRRTGRWMNSETMLVVAVGLCFLMVVVASWLGYSAAFGAFMTGSILAETVEAERIERLVAPLKDLFGAVFFVSVGMLVNPTILVDYAVPVAVLTLVVIAGQAIFGTGAFLLSGQPLPTAMQCGFSLAQIGEFAFIIASLGVSLGVTSPFLYPVVVAVSVITTFLTPYMIRAASPAAAWTERHMPGAVLQAFGRRPTRRRGQPHPGSPEADWRALLRALLRQVGAYFTLSVAVIVLAFSFLLPFSRSVFGHWPGNAVCGVLILVIASPFLRAIVMRKNHSAEFRRLSTHGRGHRVSLAVTVAVRFVIATLPVYYILDFLSPFKWWIHILVAAGLVLLMIASRTVKYISIHMERNFMQNLRWREAVAREKSDPRQPYARRLLSRNVHIARIDLPESSSWAGYTLGELALGERHAVMVAALVRGTRRINIPDGRTRLYPSDRLEVIGDDESLRQLSESMRQSVTLHEADATGHEMHLRRFTVTATAPWAGQTVATSGLRPHFRCLIVGVEDSEGQITLTDAQTRLAAGATLWAVGEESDLRRLMASAHTGEASAAPSGR